MSVARALAMPLLVACLCGATPVAAAAAGGYTVYLAADTPLPAHFGCAITWTATTTGGTDLEYQFWRRDASGWRLAQDWSSSPSYTWTPSYGDAGSHILQVWVRRQGSALAYEHWRGTSFDITTGALPEIDAFTADHDYPLTATTAVTWTAQVTAGVTTPQYEFWRLDADGWHLGQGYGSSNTYTWTPGPGDVGSHTLQVWVRNTNSPAAYEAWQGTTFSVAARGSLAIASLNADYTPAAGRATTWTAIGSGAVVPLEYQFWRRDADGWHLGRDYSSANTYTWTPGMADVGPHVLQVWVRALGSTMPYEAWRGTSFSVQVPPRLSARIQSTETLPANGDGYMSWHATQAGGAGPYEYEWWRRDADGWHLGKRYSTSSGYAWKPDSSDIGSHAVQVWVRNAGSSSDHEASASSGSFAVPTAPPLTVGFIVAPTRVLSAGMPTVVGPVLTWKALASATDIEYAFWRYDGSTGWHLVQWYGASNTYSWTPAPGDSLVHSVLVSVRHVGSSAGSEGAASSGYFRIGP